MSPQFPLVICYNTRSLLTAVLQTMETKISYLGRIWMAPNIQSARDSRLISNIGVLFSAIFWYMGSVSALTMFLAQAGASSSLPELRVSCMDL